MESCPQSKENMDIRWHFKFEIYKLCSFAFFQQFEPSALWTIASESDRSEKFCCNVLSENELYTLED